MKLKSLKNGKLNQISFKSSYKFNSIKVKKLKNKKKSIKLLLIQVKNWKINLIILISLETQFNSSKKLKHYN